jgi:hypothetical protein
VRLDYGLSYGLQARDRIDEVIAVAVDVVDRHAEDRIVSIEYQTAILRDGQLRTEQVIDRVVAVEAEVLHGLDDLSWKSGAARIERRCLGSAVKLENAGAASEAPSALSTHSPVTESMPRNFAATGRPPRMRTETFNGGLAGVASARRVRTWPSSSITRPSVTLGFRVNGSPSRVIRPSSPPGC